MAKEKLMPQEEKTEFNEYEVAEGMNETATGKRKITIDGLGDLVLKYPSRDDELEADVERSKAFTRFLLEGLKTESEMTEIAEERGLWTEKDEKNLADTQSQLIELQVALNLEEKGTKRRKLKKQVNEARDNLVRMVSKKNAIFAHTAESKAHNIQWQFLIYRCTFKEDGETRYWESFQKMLNEPNRGPSEELLAEFISFYNGLTDNFFDLWREEETEQLETGDSDGE